MITAVIEFFALGTIGFYALLFVVALIVTILEENEKGIWATITVLGTIGVLQWGIHIHILQGIIKSPGWDLAYCAGYLVIGIVWSYIKWISLVARALDRFKETKNDWMESNKITIPMGEPDLLAFHKHLEGIYGLGGVDHIAPQAKEFKGAITRWMMYWPFSMISFVLSDFIVKIYKTVFTYLANSFQAISNRAFASSLKELEAAKELKKESTYQREQRTTRVTRP
jgi:hypothetical protein